MSMNYDMLIQAGYKEFKDNSTVNGTILYNRFNHEKTFIIGLNDKQEVISNMCLNDNQIKELMLSVKESNKKGK